MNNVTYGLSVDLNRAKKELRKVRKKTYQIHQTIITRIDNVIIKTDGILAAND